MGEIRIQSTITVTGVESLKDAIHVVRKLGTPDDIENARELVYEGSMIYEIKLKDQVIPIEGEEKGEGAEAAEESSDAD